MSRRRHHHVVSRGYQRLFARGELVQLLEKVPPFGVRVLCTEAGTRDVFAERDFSSHWDADGQLVDPLEDEWQRLENVALPVVRSWLSGGDEPEIELELKVLAAIHFARSYGFRRIYESTRASQRIAAGSLAERPRLLQAFQRQYGRDPRPGELERHVLAYYDGYFGARGGARIEAMIELHNRALETLEPLHVRTIERLRLPGGPQFLLGDTPFVHYGKPPSELRAGFRDGLPIWNAQCLFMPVSPDVAVEFVTEPESPILAEPWLVQGLNQLTWRAAFRHIAGHPEADAGRCLATKGSAHA